MPDKVDMSLDDIIKTNKPRGGARGGAGGRGGSRGIGARFNNNNNNSRAGNRSRPLGGAAGGGVVKRRSGSGGATLRKPARVPDGKWLHDMYGGQAAVAVRRSGGGLVSASNSGPATITISNLDFGVNDKDIQDLFEEFGAIRKAAVHYDRSGRSLGTSDVVFEKRQDALKAIKKYNGVQLDGRAMNIKIAESADSAPVVAIRTGFSPRRGGASFRPSVGGLRRGGFSGGFSRGGRGGRGGASRGGRGGRGGANRVQKTAAELDADLDTYTTKMVTD